MKKQLLDLGNKIIESVTPFAFQLNKDFYPFQSTINLDKPQKFLFLGLNPGGGTSYESQMDNPQWNFINNNNSSIDNKIPKIMSVEQLFNGNPYFDKNAEDWKYIKGLRRIELFNEILNQDDYILANYYYLSTPDFKEVSKHGKEVLTLCKELTFRYIDLIQPELIIILGTSTGIDLLKDFKNQKTILNGHHQRLLVSAEYKNTKVIAIPHPSTFAVTYDEANAINTNINQLLNDKPLTEFNFKSLDLNSFSIDKLNTLLEDSKIKFKLENDKNKLYSCIIKGKYNEFSIKLSLKDKYFYIRDNTAKGSDSKRFYNNITNSENILYCFEYPKSEKTGSWLIQKHFEAYRFETIDELYEKIKNELIEFNKIIYMDTVQNFV